MREQQLKVATFLVRRFVLLPTSPDLPPQDLVLLLPIMTYTHEPLQQGRDLPVELQPSLQHEKAQGKDTYTASVEQGPKQSENLRIQDASETHQSPASPVQRQERWNHPRTNIARISVCFYGFVIMGANDAAYGVRSQPSLSRQLGLEGNILISRAGPHTLCTLLAIFPDMPFRNQPH